MLLSTDDLFSSWERILIIINSVTWSSAWIWICTSAHRGIPVSSLFCYSCFSVVVHVYTIIPFTYSAVKVNFAPSDFLCFYTISSNNTRNYKSKPFMNKKTQQHISFIYLNASCIYFLNVRN